MEFKGDSEYFRKIYQLIPHFLLRLSGNVLIEKCLHCRTQNVNEAFNAYVRKPALKDIVASKNVLDISVASAVVAFNDGASDPLKIMKKVGLSAGYYSMEFSRNADLIRISVVTYKAAESLKARRKKIHGKRREGILQCNNKFFTGLPPLLTGETYIFPKYLFQVHVPRQFISI